MPKSKRNKVGKAVVLAVIPAQLLPTLAEAYTCPSLIPVQST